MTRVEEVPAVQPERIDEPSQPARRQAVEHPAAPPAQRLWSRHAWVLLAALAIAFLSYYVWPRFVTLDRSRTFTKLRADVPFHYQVVVLHVVTGNVAMLTGCLQLWPWLRRKHPVVHRRSGRLYVFAGVLPCSVMGATLLALKGQPAGTIAFFWATAWFASTVAGFRAARHGRLSAHRRWMAYSIAITMAIVWNGIIGDVTIRLAAHTNPALIFDMLGWLPGVTNLAIAQWWLNRASRRSPGQAVGELG